MTARGKVLHVFKYFRPDFTGEGTFFERIAPEFRRQQPEIIHDALATLTRKPDEPVNIEGVGEIFYFRGRGNKSFATFVELFWWSLRNLWRYRTVHYHTHVDRTFASYWLARMMGCRTVLSATLDDSARSIAAGYRQRYRPLVRRLLRAFDSFVSISPRLHEETVTELGAGRAVLIPMGIYMPDLAALDRARARAALDVPADAPLLVSVAGINSRKDQLALVEAMPALLHDHPALLLALVGPVTEPVYAARVDEAIERLGLRAHVRRTGWVEKPWAWYEAADVMVFASREEGFGTVMIEAMSFALPVVARRLAGVNDAFIAHGETGFLFDDEGEYLRFVRSLLSDRDARARIGKAARNSVANRYDMRKIAAEYLAVYGLTT